MRVQDVHDPAAEKDAAHIATKVAHEVVVNEVV